MTEFTPDEARRMVILVSMHNPNDFVDDTVKAIIYKARSIVTVVSETHRTVEAFRVISDM